METIKNKVIVWSIDDFNTMGLMRQLGQSGLDLLFLIKGKAGIAAKSKYCTKFIETDSISSGFEFLKNSFLKCEYKPIVIISSDDIVTYVDIHREEIENSFILPITSGKGDVAKYIDKVTMTALANELGFLCPISRRIQWDSVIDDVQYPCLIKPSHQKPGHYNEFKTKKCSNYKQLKRTLKYVRHDSEFILQEYIPKELDVLIYGARMHDGKTVIAGAMVRDRWADSGSSSHGYLTDCIPDCISISSIEAFLDRIEYFGPFSFEFGMVGDKAYFFEVNLRNDGTSHYFFQAGANIPLAYVYSCAGLNYSLVNTKVKLKAWFIDEIYDVENVIKGRVTIKQWKKDKRQATVFKYYDAEDPTPWEKEKRGKVKQILQDFILSKYRLYVVFLLEKVGLRK
jgi:predicted ATP-grasp superfamily ATP-dependent carboligase